MGCAEIAVGIGACVWTLAVAGFDWRQRRVPNWLLLLALIPVVAQYFFSPTGLFGIRWQAALVGSGIGTLFFLPGYWLRQVGAGDVKLAAVIGAMLGGLATVWAMLIASILLGLMSVAAKWLMSAEAKRQPLPAAIPIVIGFMSMLIVQSMNSGNLQ